MATVTNWIDHLSAEEVVGAVYPGAGSSETLLVILGIVIWLVGMLLLINLRVKSFQDYLERDMVLMITKVILPTGNLK